MTEKTELLEAAIEEIDRVLLGNKSAEVNEVYLNNAKRFISESMQDTTPPFAVGEYYSDGKVIYRVLEIEEYPDTKEVRLAVLALYNGDLYEDTYDIDFPCDDKPATAEQIATFERAEQFANKGRKLDEFRVGDLIERDGELNILGNISMEEYGDVVVDGSEFTLGTLAGRYTLIQTAEEPQEVEKNTPKNRSKLNDPFHITKHQVNVDY